MAFPALAGCLQGVGVKRRTVRADSGPLIEIPTGARSQVMPQADLLPDNPAAGQSGTAALAFLS